MPPVKGKLRKNALCFDQSTFSNFALYVIRRLKVSSDWFVYSVVCITAAVNDCCTAGHGGEVGRTTSLRHDFLVFKNLLSAMI